MIDLAQQTEYPWQGQIKITFRQETGREVALRMRVPAWAETANLKVNGSAAGVTVKPGSYAEVKRAWKAGDTVELSLPMEPRLLEANPKVEEARNQVAVARGPVVYALESTDLPAGIKPMDVALPLAAKLTPRYDAALLGGVVVIEGEGRLISQGDWSGLLYRPVKPGKSESVKLKLIPYYAWNNRGVPHMSVWIPLVR
jgi:hypothetical protein